MAIFKCKMCGGDLEVLDGVTVCECEYCGTKQTVSATKDEVITNLYNRANNLRLKCEFDKAEAIYDKIVEKDDSESEAHWGIVLCKYGIEYVDDPATATKIPTCHRTLFEAIRTDADYQAAVDYADSMQQAIYEKEAIAIDKIQKNILEIVKNEKPFDVFICYKETDENGNRTIDSTIANDIYYQLTETGFKVFYAAITLEDKLGQEYEPYIFAALNSSKVMLVLGTNPMYFNAVWVKNEWSRYLKLMKTDREKLLIPCYRDMDAYELPEEFAHLQAQDMSKIGFINDVIRGIKKVLVVEDSSPAETVLVNNTGVNIEPLLKRAFMFLEDGEWGRADDFCEQVLNQDPENVQAYLGKLLAKLQIHSQNELLNAEHPFDNDNDFKKICRYGDVFLIEELQSINEKIKEKSEKQKIENAYISACQMMNNAKDDSDYIKASSLFEKIIEYKDSAQLKEMCLSKASLIKEEKRKQAEIDIGEIELQFQNKFRDSDFTICIDDEKMHSGAVSSGTNLKYELSSGKHILKLSSGDYTKECAFNVTRHNTTIAKLTFKLFRYDVSIYG